MALDGQVALGGDHLGRREVGADWASWTSVMVTVPTSKALLASASCWVLASLRPGRRQHVLGDEHVESRPGRRAGEILAGQLELGIGQGRLHLALLVLDPVLPAEQGLGERTCQPLLL